MDKINKIEKTKPTPTFLREDYPYKAIGDEIKDINSIKNSNQVYEIKCNKCEMSVRSQGVNISSLVQRMNSSGCIGCGNKNLVIKLVDIS